MSILLFFLVLFALILVHEWGHFIVAKKTGMRVDEFGIGLPPKLWGIKKGETEYTFNALPIGGFVRIFGENGVDDFSKYSNEEKTRAFGSRPKWAQALVLVAGVTMNIIFAWFLFVVVLMVGVQTGVDENTAGPSAELVAAQIMPESPASEIPVGSTILSLKSGENTLTNPTPTSFANFVESSAPEAIEVSYDTKGDFEQVSVIPVQGLLEENPDRYIVGASLAMVETIKTPFIQAIPDAAYRTYRGLIDITVGLFTFIKQAVTGTADYTQVAGPIGIVGMVGDAASFGIVALLTFTAIISLNLAVINMLPIPALDGGRLVFVAIEAITGKEIPPQWAGRVNLVGFALLMLLMIAVTYNDVLRLI